MWQDLNARELGAIQPGRDIMNVSSRRLHSLEFCTNKQTVSDYDGGINNLQVNFLPLLRQISCDRIEGRYLLAESSDSSVVCYDTLHRTSVESHSCSHIHDAIFKVDRRNPGGGGGISMRFLQFSVVCGPCIPKVVMVQFDFGTLIRAVTL